MPREKFAITTKWGPMHKDGQFLPLDFSPKACRAAVEESLRDLQVALTPRYLWIESLQRRSPETYPMQFV